MARFRLLVGTHVDKDPGGKTETNPTGSKTYEAGAIIESNDDLCFIYNTRGKLPKFELLQGVDMPLPDNYWDEEKESWEQFEARMRTKIAAKKAAEAKQPDPPKPQPAVASGKR